MLRRLSSSLLNLGLVSSAFALLLTQAAGHQTRRIEIGHKVGIAKPSDYTETILHVFPGNPDGAGPQSGVIANSSGRFFGTTLFGGANGFGSVFEMAPLGSTYKESVIYSLPGQGFGASEPNGPLWLGKRGGLVGSAARGGRKFAGIVYKLTPQPGGVYTATTLHEFYGYPDGQDPQGGIIADARGGAYFGTTKSGGANDCGIVFKLAFSNGRYRENILYAFLGRDGCNPVAGLVMDATGNLYGTTMFAGGHSNFGTVFKLTRAGASYTETTLHVFHGGKDGANPQSSLIIDANGVLYGTTPSGGGAAGAGVAYSLTPGPSGYTEHILYRFGETSGGPSVPAGSLLSDGNGGFYGVTGSGGSWSAGTAYHLILKVKRFDALLLHSFGATGDGVNPAGGLIVDKSGALYGTTYAGSGSFYGTVFRLSP